MRRLMCLVLLLSGLSVGCGDSGDDKNSNGGNGGNGGNADDGADDGDIVAEEDSANPDDDDLNGPDDGEIPGGGSSGGGNQGGDQNMCDALRPYLPEKLLGEYDGEKPFSEADADACIEKCGENNRNCYTEQNCPGVTEYRKCVSTNLAACSGAKDGKCRREVEDVFCCFRVAVSAGCNENDSDCLQSHCEAETTVFEACVNSDVACTMNEAIYAECLGEDEAGAGNQTGDDGAGDGPGTDGESIGGDLSDGNGANFSRALDVKLTPSVLRQVLAR